MEERKEERSEGCQWGDLEGCPHRVHNLRVENDHWLPLTKSASSIFPSHSSFPYYPTSYVSFFSHPHKLTRSKYKVICPMLKASPQRSCFPVPCSPLTVKSCFTEYVSLWDLNRICGSRKKPSAYYSWNKYLKGELGRHKALVISVCSLCSGRPQMCTHFSCRPAWWCSSELWFNCGKFLSSVCYEIQSKMWLNRYNSNTNFSREAGERHCARNSSWRQCIKFQDLYSGILSINLWNYTIITSIDLKLLISRKCLIGDNEIIQCDNIKNIEYFKIVKSKSLDSF